MISSRPLGSNDVMFFMKNDNDEMVKMGELQTLKTNGIEVMGSEIPKLTPFKREATLTLTNARFDAKFFETYIPNGIFWFHFNKVKNDRLKLKHVEFTINKDNLVMKIQNRVHKKSRINKKWAKRYGFTETILKDIVLEVEGEMYGQRFRFDSKSLDFRPIS